MSNNDNLSCPSAAERLKANYSYINALSNLPPTFDIGEKGRFPQMIPDPTSKSSIEFRLNQVKQAEANLKAVNARHIACQKK